MEIILRYFTSQLFNLVTLAAAKTQQVSHRTFSQTTGIEIQLANHDGL